MPDPIVVIGPAQGPAGPIAGSSAAASESAAAGADDNQEPVAPEKPRGGSAFRRIAFGAAVLTARGVWAAVVAIARIAHQYPRYSLAAAASFLILGSIAYTQSRWSTSGRAPVTNAILGDPTKKAASNNKPKDEGGTKTVATDASGASGAAPGGTSTANAGKKSSDTEIAPAAAPDNKAAAPEPSSLATLPAPKPAGNADDALPSPAVAQAPPAGENGAAEAGKTAATTDVAREGVFDPVPAPAPAHETGVASLLNGLSGHGAAASASTKKEEKNGAGSATTGVSEGLLLPAPTPVQAGPVGSSPSATNAGPDGTPVLPVAAPENGDTKGGEAPHAANEDATKHAKSEPDNKLELPNPARLPASPAEPPKGIEANSPAAPTPADNPPLPPEFESDPAPASPANNSQRAPNDAQSHDRAHGAVPDLSTPVLAAPATGGTDDPAAKKNATAAEKQTTAAAREVVDPNDKEPGSRRDNSSRTDHGVTGSEISAASSAVDARADAGPAARRADERELPKETHEARTTSAPPSENPTASSKKRELADGWLEIPNSGNFAFDEKPDVEGRSSVAEASAVSESKTVRDRRAHAAKNIEFEPESDWNRRQAAAARDAGAAGESASIALDSGSRAKTSARSGAGRVESVPHVVEAKENFWTISRLYYSNGRYYRALWKANSDKYPDINVLHVGDVIMIPPVEDLDPAYIASARSHAPAALGETARRPAGDGGELADRSEPSSRPAAARRIRAAGSSGAAAQRGGAASDPELELPLAESTIRRDRPPSRAGRPAGDDDAQNGDPEIRSVARPRGTGAPPPRRPVYKVRPYDTLRSIARDTLGDSRRADEILDLNRDLIDDPSQLVVGQILELPDDARTPLRRFARSR